MPGDVLHFFEGGAFVCSITSKLMHSVALDEAHEMCINKNLKTTIVHPTKNTLIAFYITTLYVHSCLKEVVPLLKLNEVNPQIDNIFGSPSALPRDERNIQLQSFQVDPSEQMAIDTLIILSSNIL